MKQGTFCVNHLELNRGVYKCTVVENGTSDIVTFDVRLCRPYKDPTLTEKQAHSVEHLMAKATADIAQYFPGITKLYVGPMGCFSKGTKVIMADGSLEEIQNIQTGDLVMGDDSNPREVLSLVRGRDLMYNVHQSNSKTYKVNSQHQLVLEKVTKEKKYGAHKGDKTVITVEEFYTKSDSYRKHWKGYKVGYEMPELELDIPPMILGLWLGDGVRCKPTLCVNNNEPEVLEMWRDYSASLGCSLYEEDDKGDSRRYTVTQGLGAKTPNPFMKKVHELDLYKNKHIPEKYFHSSREQRMQLLAGLVNSDGWTSCSKGREKTRIAVGSSNPRLVEDLVRLGNSLGYYTNVVEAKDEGFRDTPSGVSYCKKYYHVNFGGPIEELNKYLIEKKRVSGKEKNKDLTKSKLKVEPVGVDDFYGFVCDGNHQFLIEDGTVCHNCSTGVYVVLRVNKGVADKEVLKYLSSMVVSMLSTFETEGIPYNSKIECGNATTLTTHSVASVLVTLEEIVNKAYKNGKYDEYIYID